MRGDPHGEGLVPDIVMALAVLVDIEVTLVPVHDHVPVDLAEVVLDIPEHRPIPGAARRKATIVSSLGTIVDHRWSTMVPRLETIVAFRRAAPGIGRCSGMSSTTSARSTGTWSWTGTRVTSISTRTASAMTMSGTRPSPCGSPRI